MHGTLPLRAQSSKVFGWMFNSCAASEDDKSASKGIRLCAMLGVLQGVSKLVCGLWKGHGYRFGQGEALRVMKLQSP